MAGPSANVRDATTMNQWIPLKCNDVIELRTSIDGQKEEDEQIVTKGDRSRFRGPFFYGQHPILWVSVSAYCVSSSSHYYVDSGVRKCISTMELDDGTGVTLSAVVFHDEVPYREEISRYSHLEKRPVEVRGRVEHKTGFGRQVICTSVRSWASEAQLWSAWWDALMVKVYVLTANREIEIDGSLELDDETEQPLTYCSFTRNNSALKSSQHMLQIFTAANPEVIESQEVCPAAGVKQFIDGLPTSDAELLGVSQVSDLYPATAKEVVSVLHAEEQTQSTEDESQKSDQEKQGGMESQRELGANAGKFRQRSDDKYSNAAVKPVESIPQPRTIGLLSDWLDEDDIDCLAENMTVYFDKDQFSPSLSELVFSRPANAQDSTQTLSNRVKSLFTQ